MRNGVWVGTRSSSPLPMAGHDAVPAAGLPLYGRQERREAEGPDYCGGVTAVDERDIDPVVAASFGKANTRTITPTKRVWVHASGPTVTISAQGTPDGNRSTRPPGRSPAPMSDPLLVEHHHVPRFRGVWLWTAVTAQIHSWLRT